MELRKIGIFLSLALILVCSAKETLSERTKRASKPRQCRDKFEVMQNHTMCIAQVQQSVNVTEQIIIANLHNTIRQSVNPPAANMMQMNNIRTLAIEAQTWAEHCQLHRDDPTKRFMPGRYHVGQNILVSRGKDLSWTEVINQWVKENRTFHYNKTGNHFADVGNFVQIIWAETSLVGCGKANCSGTIFYVCNYAPSMNINIINTPYKQPAPGQPAGHLCGGHYPNGTNSLCDCSRKYCVNGADLDLNTCSCKCVTGVNTYEPKLCELTCTPNGDHSHCQAMNKTSCDTDPSTVFLCPWMCNVCPYAGMLYRDGRVPMPWEITTVQPRSVSPLFVYSLSVINILLCLQFLLFYTCNGF